MNAGTSTAPPREVARYLATRGDFATAPFPVEELVLYSSVLGPAGAAHRVEGRRALAPPAPEPGPLVNPPGG